MHVPPFKQGLVTHGFGTEKKEYKICDNEQP